jgi:hypothetical protein
MIKTCSLDSEKPQAPPRETICGLEHGKFYVDTNNELYFLEPHDHKVTHLPSEARYKPTTTPHNGLSNLHNDEVDVRQFREIDPLKYLGQRREEVNALSRTIKKYCPKKPNKKQ